MANDIKTRRQKTKTRIRGRITGTTERPRMTIYKSLKRIYVQVVDDSKGNTILSASSLEKDVRDSLKSGANIAAAKAVGARIAARCQEAGITAVVFDRNGYVYHGRVKALADSAREAGLKF